MARAPFVLAVVALLAAGCLSDAPLDDGSELEAPLEEATAAEPYRVSESFDLLVDNVDETWTWSMTEGMTGHVLIQLTGNPTTAGGTNSICYRIEWPQGHHQKGSNCNNSGNIGVSISPSPPLTTQTVYEASLVPNDFTLRVWVPAQSGPDTATLHVEITTYAAEADSDA